MNDEYVDLKLIHNDDPEFYNDLCNYLCGQVTNFNMNEPNLLEGFLYHSYFVQQDKNCDCDECTSKRNKKKKRKK